MRQLPRAMGSRQLRHFAARASLAHRRLPRIDGAQRSPGAQDRKSTRLNSSHANISYAVFCLKKKKKIHPVRLGSIYDAADLWQEENVGRVTLTCPFWSPLIAYANSARMDRVLECDTCRHTRL